MGFMSSIDLPTLLADLEIWAGSRNKAVDVAVLSQLVELRTTYDGSPPNFWPGGSIEDLLLGLWPAKGEGPAPDPEAVGQSLETFTKFLRNTGRMAAGSADPKELAREARRAAPKMAETAADRSSWSPGKVLADFAETVGVGLDGAENLDDMNARLALANVSWNALPVHERQLRMPHPGDEHTSGGERAMTAYDTDYAPHALMLSMQYELPEGELPGLTQLVPWARRSELVKDSVRLVEALDEKVSVTNTGAMRVAQARELHTRLGLQEWERGYEAATGKSQNLNWRSAHDLVSLERLWGVARACGWVRLERTAATVHPPGKLDDETSVDVALRAAMDVMLGLMSGWDEAVGLTYAVMRSYVLDRGKVEWEEIASFTDHWLFPRALLDEAPEFRVRIHERALQQVRTEAFLLADAGVFTLDESGLALTPLGDVFVSDLLTRILEMVE